MARCTAYHSVGCLAITFFLLGIGVPFLSFSFWANQWADADNFEYYLTKNSQSMVWYDCITTWAPVMPTPTASTTYLLSAPPTYSNSGQDFSFTTSITWNKNSMFMHLLPGSVITVSFTANTIVNLYIVEGWNNYNSYWHTNPVLSATGGTVTTTINTADDYYWIFDTGITSFSGRATFNGTKILYDIDPNTIWSSSSGSNTLCVPWSDREKDFWILIEGPQITTDPTIFTNLYPFELVWERRWSFIGPLMAGIFVIVGLIIPGILVVVMRKFMRHPSTYDDDMPTEYSTYNAAPSYTAAPVYTQPPATQYGGYQQPAYNQPAPYSQQVAPSYGQAFSQQQAYQPYNNNPPKY